MTTKARQAETIKFLTTDEIKRLFSVISKKRDKAIFLLAYRHGLRASEVGLLQLDDIDYKKMRLHVHRLKGSISGVHTIQADEMRYIKAHLKHRTKESPYLFVSNRGTPIHRNTLGVLIKKYAEKANLPKEKRYFHILKHSIATHLLDDGEADIRFVQDWLGHSNIQNTVIYANLANKTRDRKARASFMKMPKF